MKISELTKKLMLKRHFITLNAFSCIEINAHALIFFISFMKEASLDSAFNTESLGSEQCENLFRQIRSLRSTFSTVTNASVLEIIRKIAKIELMNKISYTALADYNFHEFAYETNLFLDNLVAI